MSNFNNLVILSITTFFMIFIFNKIGWLYIGFIFLVLIVWGIFYFIKEDRKIKDAIENRRYDEYIESLRNREHYDPLFPNREEKVAPSDLIDEISTIATGKVSWTDKEGKTTDLFDIEINIKSK